MKNTTFRKKALLSSVAMLLVAIVALGSATFAWFTASPEVTAQGISMKATTDAGLQILSGSEKALGKTEFGPTTVLNAEAGQEPGTYVTKSTPIALSPLSFCEDDTSTIQFATATAAEMTSYAHTGEITTGLGANYTEDIYLKSSVKGTDISVKAASVKINPSAGAANSTLVQAIRVMLVSGNDVIGIWSTDGIANKYMTSSKAVSGDVYSDNYASKAVASTDLAITPTGNDKVTMYVWLDGEDSECYTTNVDNTLAQLVDSIDVKFSINSSINWPAN